MSAFDGGLDRSFTRLSDRLSAGVAVGEIGYFDEIPSNDWIAANGAVVDRTSDLAAILDPSVMSGMVVGTSGVFSSAARDGCFGNGKFVISSIGAFFTTTDAVTWTTVSTLAGTNHFSITFGNGLFISTDGARGIWLSNDNAQSFSKVATYSSALLAGSKIGFVGGLFVLIPSGAASNVYLTSPNGIDWTQRTLPVSTNWQDIDSDGVSLIAVGTNYVVTTTDGLTWLSSAVSGGLYCSVSERTMFAGTTGNAYLFSEDLFATSTVASADGTARTRVCRIGEELISTPESNGNAYARNFGAWKLIYTAPSGNTVVVVSGNGIAIVVFSASYIRSTKLRTPRLPSRGPLKPFIRIR